MEEYRKVLGHGLSPVRHALGAYAQRFRKPESSSGNWTLQRPERSGSGSWRKRKSSPALSASKLNCARSNQPSFS